MKSISEESIFLLQNWSIVEKLQASIKHLEKEIVHKVNHIGEEIKDKDWWNSKIIFTEFKHGFYFAKKKWNKYIQIGIEHFQPESLIGSSDHKSWCYLWIKGPEKDNINSSLENILKKDEYFNEYYISRSSYLLKKVFRKHTEENYEDFMNDDFLNEYVEFLEKVYLKIQSFEIPSNS